MTQTDTIRRRADGSIDTAHYIARGRLERSRAAHRMARQAAPAPRGILAVLVAVVAAAVTFGKQG